MAYFTIGDARRAYGRIEGNRTLRNAVQQLNEQAASVRTTEHFNIFLSHCVADAELILGVKRLLEEEGHKVYVDWIVDKQLDRGNVSPDTANTLRERMRASDSMLFATSESSPTSKWMPWELGYFDGLRQGRIAVLPLVAAEGESFKGQEYLGLYPVVEKLPSTDGNTRPYVTRGPGSKTFIPLAKFRAGDSTFITY